MKKILFVAAALGGGGAERVMLNLANALYDKGNDVVILQTTIDKKAKYSINDGIVVESIKCEYKNKIRRIWFKYKQIRRYIKKYSDYTVVSFLPDVNIYCILASIGVNNRVVVSERNDPAREPGSILVRKIRDISYKWADYVVFQTKDAQQYFEKKIQKKSCVIPNPLVNSQLPFLNFNEKRKNVIVMVCRVKPQKNVEMMIDAVNLIKGELGDYKVEIYGDGNLYRDNIKKKTKELGIDNIVKFMGPSKNVYDVMKNSKIYVSTSDYEGISNTMLEALAIGLPSIVTDCPIGGARMFINNNKNGILVPVGDSKKLSYEIIRLINDEKLQQRLSSNSIKNRKILDIDIISQKWLEIL